MKTKIYLIVFMAYSLLSYSQTNQKEKKDIFDLNSIKADQEYYSQAILQYQIIEKIISKYGSIYHLYPKENQKLFIEKSNTTDINFDAKNGVPTMVLFPNAQEKSTSNDEINLELSKLGVDRCQYEIPLKLDDLDGGFQFNHYLFNSDNKAALDAFGIVKNGFEAKSLYIVIDYLQHKDFNCTGLPKIRYGVGIRSEIKISEWSNKMDFKESSLAGLAANAELNSLKVNITVKTIGITGLDSKLNIPNNTNFNVDTYADYQKIIDFIRNFEQSDETKTNYKKIKFKPQIIPVMDEYRTSVSESFAPYYESLENLEKKIKKLSSKRNKYINDKKAVGKDKANILDKMSVDIYESKVNALSDEMTILNDRKKDLTNANIYNNDLKRYVKILSIISNSTLALKDSTLENELNPIKESINTIKSDKFTSADKAKNYERDGFNFLFDKNLSDAINSFQMAENSYSGYHSVFEIKMYLSKLSKENLNWKNIYSKILNDYNYKLPTDIIEKLKLLTQ